jgi:threonine 3-dehydrogenase
MQAVVKIAPAGGTAGTEVRDVPQPQPGPEDVLIRVAAAGVCGTDKHIYHWDPSIRDRVVPPRIYGHEFCGFVEDLGDRARRSDLAVGDYVSAEMHVVCGHCAQCRSGNGHVCPNTRVYGLEEDGCFAQFVKVPATNVIKLSRDVPLRVGAFLDALGNAVHTTQVCDLAGKSVAITGFGAIGAMAASVAEQSGASAVIVTDVNDHALEVARRWASSRNLGNFHAFNTAANAADSKKKIDEITDGVGVDLVCEMSGAPAAINFALDIVRFGGDVSLLGLPKGHAVTLDDYTRNVILKGVTLHGIIGRRMYSTWQRMLSLLKGGLDVGWIVQATFESLGEFHDAMARRESLKVVFFPEGEQAAERRLRA